MHGRKMRAFRYTLGLTVLSTVMEVTVRGMDATFEHPWTDWLRVTVMAVLNRRYIMISYCFISI